MKLKNIIGKILFALIGLWCIFLVIYKHSVDYLDVKNEVSVVFGWKDAGFIALGFVFFWGSARFIKISDAIIEAFKSRFNFKNQ